MSLLLLLFVVFFSRGVSLPKKVVVVTVVFLRVVLVAKVPITTTTAKSALRRFGLRRIIVLRGRASSSSTTRMTSSSRTTQEFPIRRRDVDISQTRLLRNAALLRVRELETSRSRARAGVPETDRGEIRRDDDGGGFPDAKCQSARKLQSVRLCPF